MSDVATAGQMITLGSLALRVNILPKVGGKIAQILDIRSGKKILVPPLKPYSTIPQDACWLDYDLSGMDDCFPNIAPGPYPAAGWTGTRLPDHGEWVYGAWTVEAATEESIRLQRVGNVLPYTARKTIRIMDEDTIRIDYAVQNNGDIPVTYLWAAHPLILIDEHGYRLTLPKGTRHAQTLTKRIDFEWPLLNGVDLAREWITSGTSLKLFVLDLTEGWCELALSHSTLRFDFDLTVTPKLGIWLNNFGFPAYPQSPFRCVAVEPCTNASDELGALPTAAYPAIAAGSTSAWAITLKIGLSDENHEC
jgi:hypothetical protein